METTINIWDSNVSHCSNIKEAGLRCGVRDKSYDLKYDQNVKWVSKLTNFYDEYSPKITVFTDSFFNKQIINSVNSNLKIGLLFEPKSYTYKPYENVKYVENDLDLIFTFDQELLSRNSKKYKFFPADWVCIEPESHGIHNKKNLISTIYSNKGGMDRPLRNSIAQKYNDKVNAFGSGTNKGQLNFKSESLKDYMFSIVLENSVSKNYYTEKILDCFVTGNIPIYRGATNIGDFFDEKGIIKFNDVYDLEKILNEINSDMYEHMISSVKNNFEISKKYLNPDDTLFELIKICLNNINYDTKDYFKYGK